MTIRIKNKSISTLKRKKIAQREGKIDIEDPWYVGKKKYWGWECKKCGSKLEPYKQDQYGDIVMSCTNPGCYLNKMHVNSLNVRLARLLKQQQQNSTLYYKKYDGGYY